jgi:hypothetical protein
MNDVITGLLQKIRTLEDEIEDELESKAKELRYQIENGRVIFEREVLARHKEFKTNLFRYIKNARISVILTAPVIYSLIIPFVILDIFITVYQLICFPIYGIPKVRHRDHIVFDRVKLGYLNLLEKFNCLYCSYGNGLIAYAMEVAARTEQYWCPIKHAQKTRSPHRYYHLFTDFGDGEQYREKLPLVRNQYSDRT